MKDSGQEIASYVAALIGLVSIFVGLGLWLRALPPLFIAGGLVLAALGIGVRGFFIALWYGVWGTEEKARLQDQNRDVSV